MKKTAALTVVILLFASTLTFAGGDKNQHRHDGDKGKGSTKQERINK